MNKPPIIAPGGYVINHARIKKPLGVYLNYGCRPIGKLTKLCRRWGMIRIGDAFNDLDTYFIKILLRRYYGIGIAHKTESKPKTSVLSNDKNSD